MIKYLLIITIFGVVAPLQLVAEEDKLQTVEQLDIEKFLGRWYQIAFFPTRFQKADCGVIVTADYGLDDRGRVTIENTCWADYEMTESNANITGTATVVDDSNTKLKVRFFWWLPVRSDFWIIDLDKEGYKYAVISEPGRSNLWILARENRMDKALFNEIIDRLKNKGFDLDNLAITAPVD